MWDTGYWRNTFGLGDRAEGGRRKAGMLKAESLKLKAKKKQDSQSEIIDK